MTDYQQRKQCPFAFNRSQSMHNLNCLEDQCMAWIPECQLVDPKYKDAPGDCMDQIPGKRCRRFYRIDCQGYCKLIERGS